MHTKCEIGGKVVSARRRAAAAAVGRRDLGARQMEAEYRRGERGRQSADSEVPKAPNRLICFVFNAGHPEELPCLSKLRHRVFHVYLKQQVGFNLLKDGISDCSTPYSLLI